MSGAEPTELATLRRTARELAQGQNSAAAQAWHAVLQKRPADPEAANALGNLALAAGDAQAACSLLTIATRSDPGQPALLFNLSAAKREVGDRLGAIAALDEAIAADPYFIQALFQRGILLEESGNLRGAAQQFRDFLDTVPPEVAADPGFAPTLDRARRRVIADGEELADAIAGAGTPPSRRLAGSISNLTSGAPLYRSEPTFLTIPELPAEPFLAREDVPWLAGLEAATAIILDEALALLAARGVDRFVPYVDNPPGTPLNQWRELDRNADWGALFLWKHGSKNSANCAEMPRTSALLEALPLLRLEQRAPNAFLSRLAPHTRIPPHNGVTNARVTVHLPLIVPAGCGFRVGGETREWRVGEAWVFDDTIEHEAWNDSGEPRLILIVDTWNPRLTLAEQAFLAASLVAYDQHYGRRRADRGEL